MTSMVTDVDVTTLVGRHVYIRGTNLETMGGCQRQRHGAIVTKST